MLDTFAALGEVMAQHWTVWLVTVVLILAAVIDGFELKVPNWVTFPFILSGWVYSGVAFGWEGLAWSLGGTVLGLLLLLPAYAIGGMGAGDVKLLAGIGAWIYASQLLYSFAIAVIVGAVLAVAMVLIRGEWKKHKDQFFMILNEIMVIRNPEQLAQIAAKRKPTMMLLPYGIPITIGTIVYFLLAGLLI
ncbi:prepilin peptidase [Anatilimnocola sp. NA78]|uniref:A24 family peptidase n=1 Tax=Anatilimnocola sp. NA78 TaxID=3415683 RepID=UPI003CE48682